MLIINEQCQASSLPTQALNIATGLQPSDYSKALEQVKIVSNRYNKGEQVKCIPGLKYFKIYGIGIYLFLAFIKFTTLLFLILTGIAIPPIVINNLKGNVYLNKNLQYTLSTIVTRSSLGNYRYSLLPQPDAYSHSISYKVFNVSLDLIACLVYLIFCLYWQHKSMDIIKGLQRQVKLLSARTVELVHWTGNLTERQVQQYVVKVLGQGNVVEVVGVRDYTLELQLCQQIYEIQTQIKQRQFTSDYKQTQKTKDKIMSLQQNISCLYKELQNIETRPHKIIKYYIQFQTIEQRKKFLKKFQPHQSLLSCCRKFPLNFTINDSKVQILPCNTEPTGILWENAHVSWKSRIPRIVVQALIILVVICSAFLIVSFLNVISPPFQIDIDVDITKITFEQIKQSLDQALIYLWCIHQYNPSSPPNTRISQLCAQPWKLYTRQTIINFSISIVLIVFMQILKRVIYGLANFQRYATHAEKSVTILTNLFIVNFVTTTLATFLMQGNLFGLSVLQFFRFIFKDVQDIQKNINKVKQYDDVTTQWYKDVGYQLWFNILVMIALPQLIQPLKQYISQKLSHCLCHREKVQKNMVKKITPNQFQIEDFYAQILLVIATGFIFGGGIPIMMPVVFFCILVRYFYIQYYFIRFCRVSAVFNEVLNNRVLLIMKVILIIRFIMSIYMYGAEDLFVTEKSVFSEWVNGLDVPVIKSVFVVVFRIVCSWYYAVIAVLFVAILLFKDVVFIGILKLKMYIKNSRYRQSSILPSKTDSQKQPQRQLKIEANQHNNSRNNLNNQNQNEIQQYIQTCKQSNSNDNSIYSEIRSQRTSTSSYRLQKNPFYQEILVIMRMKGQRVKTKG